MRIRPLPALLAAAAALLAACGSTEPTAAQAPEPAPARHHADATPMPEEGSLAGCDQPDWSDPASQAVGLPVPHATDASYWSLSARDADSGNLGAPQDVELAQAPDRNGVPAPSIHAARAGAFLVQRSLHAGRIHGIGRDCWLIAMPVVFMPDAGFAPPLSRISVALDLSRGRGWGVIAVPSVGWYGLRRAPGDTGAPGPFYFRAPDLAGELNLAGEPARAGWRLDRTDTRAMATQGVLYALLVGPSGGAEIDAVVRARLRFTEAGEGFADVPPTHVRISVVR
jgi:hypothetical protein